MCTSCVQCIDIECIRSTKKTVHNSRFRTVIVTSDDFIFQSAVMGRVAFGTKPSGRAYWTFYRIISTTRVSSPSNVVFYSVDCAGQHKNKFVTSQCTYAVPNPNVRSIRHKFLIVGRTRNEGDCVDAICVRETKTKKRKLSRSGAMYIPGSTGNTLMKTAEQHGKAYDVKGLSTEDLYGCKNLSIGKMCTRIMMDSKYFEWWIKVIPLQWMWRRAIQIQATEQYK